MTSNKLLNVTFDFVGFQNSAQEVIRDKVIEEMQSLSDKEVLCYNIIFYHMTSLLFSG